MGRWHPAPADDGGWGTFALLTAHWVKPFLLSAYPSLDFLTLGLRVQPEDGMEMLSLEAPSWARVCE